MKRAWSAAMIACAAVQACSWPRGCSDDTEAPQPSNEEVGAIRKIDLGEQDPAAVRRVSVDLGKIQLDPAVAELVIGSVEIRRVGSVTWEPLTIGTRISPGDAVRTGEGGGATLSYAGRASIGIKPNSLVIVREATRNEDDTQAEVDLELRNGLVVTRVNGNEKQVALLRFRKDIGIVRISSADGLEHKVTAELRADEESGFHVTVHRGKAWLESGDEKLDVGTDEKGSLNVDGELSKDRVRHRGSRLSPPTLVSPSSRAQFARDTSEVRLRWRGVKGATFYQVQADFSPRFNALFVDEFVQGTTFTLEPQGDPVLYWRVRALGEGGQRSPFSHIRMLRFGQKKGKRSGGPALTINSPADGAIVRDTGVVVKGTTAPGASVWVNGKRARVSSRGRFEASIKVQKGTNSVVVEARHPKSSGRTITSHKLIVK